MGPINISLSGDADIRPGSDTLRTDAVARHGLGRQLAQACISIEEVHNGRLLRRLRLGWSGLCLWCGMGAASMLQTLRGVDGV